MKLTTVIEVLEAYINELQQRASAEDHKYQAQQESYKERGIIPSGSSDAVHHSRIAVPLRMEIDELKKIMAQLQKLTDICR